MESSVKHSSKTVPPSSQKPTDATLQTLRKRNKDIILFFAFLFVSLFLVIAAIFTYLFHDVIAESRRKEEVDSRNYYAPHPNLYKQSLTHSLLSLEKATAFIESKFNPRNDLKTEVALRNCSNLLRVSLGEIKLALQDDQIAPKRILLAKQCVSTCREELEKEGSGVVKEAAMQKVIKRAVMMVEWNEEVVDRIKRHERRRRKKKVISIKLENLFMVCLAGIQFSVVACLLWFLRRIR